MCEFIYKRLLLGLLSQNKRQSEEIRFKVLLGVELSVTRVCVKMFRLVVGDRSLLVSAFCHI